MLHITWLWYVCKNTAVNRLRYFWAVPWREVSADKSMSTHSWHLMLNVINNSYCIVLLVYLQRISTYQRLVSAAYATALSVPATNTKVISISCDGSSIYGTDGASYKPSPGRTATRLLLSSEGLESLQHESLQQKVPVPASSSTWLDIRTVIAVPAPADLSRRSQILETVSSSSANILAGPISQFLQVQSLVVRSADPVVANSPSSKAPESQPTGGSELLNPESGELVGEDALPVEAYTALLPTDWSSTPAVSSTGAPASSDAPESHMAASTPNAPVAPPASVAEAPSSSAPLATAVPATATAETTTVDAPTELQLSTFPWNPIKKDEAYASAPACLFSPTQTNSVTDAHGRLWSLMNDKECAFRCVRPVISYHRHPS